MEGENGTSQNEDKSSPNERHTNYANTPLSQDTEGSGPARSQDHGDTPLHKCVRDKSLAALKDIVSSYKDKASLKRAMEVTNNDGWTPLIMVVSMDWDEGVDVLLGTQVLDKEDITHLVHKEIIKRKYEITTLTLGSDLKTPFLPHIVPHPPEDDQWTVFSLTAAAGWVGGLKLLIKAGVRVPLNLINGYNVLHLAITSGNEELPNLVLDALDDRQKSEVVNHKQGYMNIYSSIFYAIEMQFCRLVRRLLQYVDADLAAGDEGCNILHHAAAYAQPGSNGESDVWSILLEENNPRHNLIKEMLLESYNNSDIGTPLHTAASVGNLYSVRFLCKKYNKWLTAKDYNGDTPLHCAAAAGRDEVIRYIVYEDLSTLMATNDDDYTPLASAIISDENDELLLNLGVPSHKFGGSSTGSEHETITMDDINKSYGTTLCVAAMCENLKCIRTLHEEYGVSLRTKDREGQTPLHHAAEGRDEIIHYIVEKDKTTLTAKDDKGYTPLAIAIISGENVELLLNLGVPSHKFGDSSTESEHETITTDDINKFYGITLCVAATWGNLKCVQTLHELYGVSLTTKDREGKTPLHHAAEGKHEIIRYIVDKDEKTLTITDDNGYTPLAIAIKKHAHSTVELLLELGASHLQLEDLKTAFFIKNNSDDDTMYCNPLQTAVQYGKLETFSILCHKHSYLLTTKDRKGWIPLHYATAKGRDDMIKYIVGDLGWSNNLHFTDNDGYTPLAIAIINNNDSSIKLLLHHTAIVYCTSYFMDQDTTSRITDKLYGPTIRLAAKHGYKECVEFIHKENNELLSTKDDKGWTPLHYAAAHGRDEVIRYIMSENSKTIKAKDIMGNTPLITAIVHKNESSVKLLLELGASLAETISKGAEESLSPAETSNVSSVPPTETPYLSDIPLSETSSVSTVLRAETPNLSDIPPSETSDESTVPHSETPTSSLVKNDCKSLFTQLFFTGGHEETSALQLILEWWKNEKLAKDLLNSCIKGNLKDDSVSSINSSESHVQLHFKIFQSEDGRWFNFVHLLQGRQELLLHPVTESLVWQSTQDVKHQIYYNSAVHCVCLWFFYMLQTIEGHARFEAVDLPFLFLWLIFVYIQDLHNQARCSPSFFVSVVLFCSIFAAIVLSAFEFFTSSEMVITLSALLFYPVFLRIVSYFDQAICTTFLHVGKAVAKFLMIAAIVILLFVAVFMIKVDIQDPLNDFGKSLVSKAKKVYIYIVEEITFDTIGKVITGLTAVGSLISKMELDVDWIKKFFEAKDKPNVGEAIIRQATVLESLSRSYLFNDSKFTTSIKVYHDRKLDNKDHGSFIFGNRIWECVADWYVNQSDPERKEDKKKFMEAKGLQTNLCEVKSSEPSNNPTGE